MDLSFILDVIARIQGPPDRNFCVWILQEGVNFLKTESSICNLRFVLCESFRNIEVLVTVFVQSFREWDQGPYAKKNCQSHYTSGEIVCFKILLNQTWFEWIGKKRPTESQSICANYDYLKDSDQEVDRHDPVNRNDISSAGRARKSIGKVIKHKHDQWRYADQVPLFPGETDS